MISENRFSSANNRASLFLRGSILALCFVTAALAQRTPELSISETRVESGAVVDVRGAGFTPKRYALSHLRKPDGTEFHVRRFLANDRGEFFHRIDTVMLDPGAYELWAVDADSKTVSKTVRFEVTP